MSKIIIIANINVKPENIDLVKAELLNLIETSRKEEGCINYDLHQDNNNPAHFVFYEIWESRDLWQAHSKNTHVVAYKKAIGSALENVSITEMKQLA